MIWIRRIASRLFEHLRGRSLTELALIAGALAVVLFVGFQSVIGH